MSSPTPDLDVQLALLADAERRWIIAALSRHGRPLTVRDLAIELVTERHERPLTDVPAEAMRDTAARLHHVHLPKLAEAGVLEYDADRRRIDDLALDGLRSTLTTLTDDAG